VFKFRHSFVQSIHFGKAIVDQTIDGLNTTFSGYKTEDRQTRYNIRKTNIENKFQKTRISPTLQVAFVELAIHSVPIVTLQTKKKT